MFLASDLHQTGILVMIQGVYLQASQELEHDRQALCAITVHGTGFTMIPCSKFWALEANSLEYGKYSARPQYKPYYIQTCL